MNKRKKRFTFGLIHSALTFRRKSCITIHLQLFFTLTMPETTAPVHPSFLHKWGSLIVMSLALAIIIIDTTLLNVSLGTIIRELKTNIQSLQWVITAYSLTLAALTITGGRIGDLFGRKKMFVLGAIIFAIGSFIASISNNIPTLLIGESIIEGIGAALMMPATASLLVANFRGRDRAVAFGVWGGIAGAASAIGPILGGFLTTHYSWRWGFRINVVVAALLVIGSMIVKESRDEEERPTLDFIGVILSAVGLLGIVFGIIESSTYGWWTAKEVFIIGGHALRFGSLSIVPVSILIGIVFVLLFLRWQNVVARRGGTPLVSLSLFRNRQFVSGMLTTAVQSLGMTGLVFSLPVFFQAVRKLDAFHTGLTLLPMSITVLIVAPLGVILVKKFVPKYVIIAGLFINTLGAWLMYSRISIDATAMTLAPALVVYGIGMGLVMAQIGNLTLSAVSVQQAGEASGVNNTLRQIGTSFGSAIIGAILLTSLATNMSNGIKNSTLVPEAAKPAIVQALSSQQANIEFSNGVQLGPNIPPAVTKEIEHIAAVSTTEATKQSLLYTIAFTFAGFLVAFGLPSVKNLEKEQHAVGK